MATGGVREAKRARGSRGDLLVVPDGLCGAVAMGKVGSAFDDAVVVVAAAAADEAFEHGNVAVTVAGIHRSVFRRIGGGGADEVVGAAYGWRWSLRRKETARPWPRRGWRPGEEGVLPAGTIEAEGVTLSKAGTAAKDGAKDLGRADSVGVAILGGEVRENEGRIGGSGRCSS